jgi:hypothetical protein
MAWLMIYTRHLVSTLTAELPALRYRTTTTPAFRPPKGLSIWWLINSRAVSAP